MIYKISKKISDEKLLTRFVPEKTNPDKKGLDYKDVIVKKPWGYEYLVFENDFVAIWMLHIVRKRKTSMHAHLNKKTALILLSGNANCFHTEGEINLEPMDAIIIEEGSFHSTEAFSLLPIQPVSENGILVMEIESPPVKTDLLRIKDEYGRKLASYEGGDHIVFNPKKCLKLKQPKRGTIIQKAFLNYEFKVMQGDSLRDKDILNSDALVSIIAKINAITSNNPYLKLGEISKFKDFCDNTRHEELSNYTFLTIKKEKTLVKLSDYIFSFIAELGVKEVFAVCGGGAMHLVDSLGRNKNLKYVATHHEQAAAMAAEGYARISGKPGVALVTSGPGGTNTLTGVCGAWIDSIATIFISGQVTTDTLIKDTGLRQFGVQEADIIKLVRPITKYAVTITDPSSIKYHLQKAVYLATHARPGPVWLDIPLDIQSKIINPAELVAFNPAELKEKSDLPLLKSQVANCIKLLKKAKRPVLICGYGIRLAKAEKEFRELVARLNIPLISSWTTSDLIPTNHKFYIGRSGIMGDRASNFTVQNSDLLLIIGSRMSVPQVGYNYKTFAREAKKIMVDIDKAELKKPSIKADVSINADAKEFLKEALAQLKKAKLTLKVNHWVKRCQQWKARYPVVLAEYKENKKGVNSFYFIDVLSKKLSKDAVVVTDMGTAFTCTMQTFKIKAGQRLFTSSGHSPMGFGLPGSIGACFANDRKKIICIVGDGALQMNIQELQTIVHYKLPIIIFVLNNAGYLTIKLMQQNHFGRYVGSEPLSGLSFPDTLKIAKAYGIKSERISNNNQLHAKIDKVLSLPGPFICEIIMPENQRLIPRVSSLKKPDGTIISKPLEDLYPFLDRDEFLKNMIVRPVEILKE